MKSGSESVIRMRCRGKERSEKGADGGQRERKSIQGHFFNIAEAHLSIKNSCWSVSRNFLVSMVAK